MAPMPYVRLENEEGIATKKTILSAQMGILEISGKIQTYKKLRKIEIAKKALVKRELRNAILKVNSLLAFLPEPESSGIRIHRPEIAEQAVKKDIEIKKSGDISSQLAEIKERLSRL